MRLLGKSDLTNVVLLLFFLGVAAIAQSDDEPLVTDRPDLTDASVTVGHMRLQAEFGLLWERLEGKTADFDYLSVPILLRYGIGGDFELRLETASLSGVHTLLTCCGPRWKSGFSPIDIGFKYHFKDAGEASLDPSMGAIVMIGLPSGTKEFRSDAAGLMFKLALDFDLAPGIGLGPNFGFLNEEDDLSERFTAALVSASLGFDLAAGAGAFAEFSFESAGSSEDGSILILDGGFTYLFSDNAQYDIALGKAVRGEGVPDFFLTTGLSLRF